MLPPGPRAPALWQFLRWVYRPLELLDEYHERFGSWFTLRFPHRLTLVFTSDPEAIKDVFAADPDSVHAGEPNIVLLPLLGPRSLLLLDGPAHRRARRLLMPPFHGERMQAYGRTMAQIATRHAASWPRGTSFRLHPALQALTLDVILGTVFGMSEDTRVDELRDLLARILNANSNPAGLLRNALFLNREGHPPFAKLQERLGMLTDWGRFAAQRCRIDAIVYEEIARRRAAPDPRRDDVLSLLVQSRTTEGEALTDGEIRDELITLLIAGHETTSASGCWVLHRLATHADVRARLLAELDRAFGSGPIDPAELGALPYLDAVVNESLRLDPVVLFVWRVLQRPLQLGGRQLPAGVAIAPCPYLVHRRPELWPDPERFDPERFLARKPAPWEFLPFGGGGRRCIGMAFALYELKIVTAQLARLVDLRPPEGTRTTPVRRWITLAPKDGMPMIAEPARSPEQC